MSGIQKRIATMAAAMALAFGCLCALPAFAQAQPQVMGADSLTTQESAAGPGYIDVLSVQGKEGDQIYVNVDHNGDAKEKVVKTRAIAIEIHHQRRHFLYSGVPGS